jgi:hypothetical protein
VRADEKLTALMELDSAIRGVKLSTSDSSDGGPINLDLSEIKEQR